jgi:hypothetical protein
LEAVARDYVDGPDETEFWGTDDLGNAWRVHMPY